MLTKRPNEEPDVIAHNIRFVEIDGQIEIQYDLYYKREQQEEWRIPLDSTFEPPEWFVEGIDIVAWTENRGTKRRPDWEWLWVEEMGAYNRSNQSSFTKQVRRKNFGKELRAIQKKLDDTISTYGDLFE